MSQTTRPDLSYEKPSYYSLPPDILVGRTLLVVVPLALVLFALSRFNFLLYHGLVEFFVITVAFTIFSVGWNARHFVNSNSLLVLAVGYLALCPLQLLHLATYKGLAILPVDSPNPATQLWIAGRYLESLTFVVSAGMLPQRKLLPPYLLLAAALGISSLLLVLVWPLQLFPDCFVTGEGLTSFKIASEYLVCLLFGLALFCFWRRRVLLDRRYLVLLTGSILMAIAAELAFTLYQDVYGFSNFLGHFFKLTSVVFLYRALVSGALRTPYAVLFSDLSRAKESLDRELEQRRLTEIELRQTNQELEAFVRTVSHDLRTPLTPIIGLANYLQERLADRDDGDSIEALRTIEKQGQRMARILEDLLAFARSGHMRDADLEVAPLDDILDRVLEDLGSQLIVKNLEVQREPLPKVLYPRTVIFQIFSNLVSNAIKYAATPRGIRIEGTQKESGGVELRVIDYGPGVPVAEREKIFEIFYRQRCHDDILGSGIGLATVKKLVERHQGSASVEETPGGGATFIISLPPFEIDTSSLR